MSATLQLQNQKEKQQPRAAAAINADKGAGPAAENGHGLPGALQAKMESAMGADFSNVNIHTNSSQASLLGAHAYTQGNDVHFAPGKFNPENSSGQELIGHELAHVVQQRQGRVQPTAQAKGLPVNDHEGLETEADRMGSQAAKSPFSNTVSTTQAPAQMKTTGVVQMWNPFKKKKKNNVDLGDGKVLNNPTTVSANNQHTANPTQKVTFNDNIGNSGSNSGYFKGDTGVSGEAGGGYEQGIIVTDPDTMQPIGPSRSAARAVASSRLDKAIGTNVLSEEFFGDVNGQKGSISGQVDGKQLISNNGQNHSLNHFDFSNPLTQKGMSDLQMLDFISGQTDRHGGNIIVGNGGQVKGIDNDVAFGSVDSEGKYGATSEQQARGIVGARKGLHNHLGLPSQVDSQTAKSILGMKAKNLGKVLNDPTKGPEEQLTDKEIKVAQERFRRAKKHIKGLKKTGGIVENWNDETYQKTQGDHEVKPFKERTYKKSSNYIGKHEALREDPEGVGGMALRHALVEQPQPQQRTPPTPPSQSLKPNRKIAPMPPPQHMKPKTLSPEIQKRQNMDQVLKEAFPFY